MSAVTKALPDWRDVAHSAPDEVRKAIKRKRPVLKDLPRLFAGREAELEDIQDCMEDTVAAGAQGIGAPTGLIIQSAPGAGKTSLLEQAKLQLQGEGYAVLELEADDVGTGDALTSRIRDQQPWSDDEWLGELATGITEGLVNTGDALAKGLARTATAAGIPIDTDHLEPMKAAITAIRERRAAPANAVLRLLPHASKRGTMVMLDEAQLLKVHLKTEREAHAREIIRTLSTAAQRRKGGLSHVNVVYAGLGDTTQALRQLGSLRLSRRSLGPLSPEAQMQVLADGIQHGTNGDEDLTRTIAAAWMPTLMQVYGDWAHHTQGAAQAAEAIVRAALGAGESPLAPWGLPAALELGRRNRNVLYREILASCDDLKVPDAVIIAVAADLAAHGNRRVPEDVRATIGEARARVKARSEDATTLTTEEIYERMRRAGVLEATVGDEDDDNKLATVSVPVPSFLAHILGPGDGSGQNNGVDQPQLPEQEVGEAGIPTASPPKDSNTKVPLRQGDDD